jgi:D-glycerate 3-kinase
MDSHQLTALLNTLTSPLKSADAGDTLQPFWQWSLLAQALAPSLLTRQCRVVAVTGSQGSGKSTFAKILVSQLKRLGKSAACVSLDDFYLSKQARADLAREVHPLLVTRGVPGTHDSQRLYQVLERFALGKGSVRLALPQFDKGSDDRVADTEVAAELLVVEGWCLGVQPQPPTMLEHPVNDLEKNEDAGGTWRHWTNEQIRQNYLPVWQLVDEWLLLQPPEFTQVVQWRRQQEMDLLPSQRMSETALQRFIQHYQRLTQWQWQHPIRGQGLKVDLTPEHDISNIHVLAQNA